jgi:hypothetical protein
MEVLSKLFRSQKFLVLLASGIGLLITKLFKIEVDPSTILQGVILISGYLVGQGISDAGKGAAKVQAISALTADSSVSATETKKAIEEVKAV